MIGVGGSVIQNEQLLCEVEPFIDPPTTVESQTLRWGHVQIRARRE